MSGSQSERREARRFPVELHVEFRHLGRPAESYADVSRDLSRGGVFLATSVGLPVGTVVSLMVSPGPQSPFISLHAEVVRVEHENVGTASRVTAPARGMALRFLPDHQGEVDRLIALAQSIPASEETYDVQLSEHDPDHG